MNQKLFGEILLHTHLEYNIQPIHYSECEWICMAIQFLKGCYIFHLNGECSLHRSSINIYKCQNNKEGSKILLTFNMLMF
jgi:hypothetical protein